MNRIATWEFAALLTVMDYQDENIIVFDGVCNLCNGLVRFVIKHDRKGTIRFAPLQSDFGKNLQSGIKPGTRNSDTVVYSRKGISHFRSDAILYLLKDMGGIWSVFYIFRIIPSFLRNLIYNVVAANRYRVFGKRDTCMVPGPEIKERFLQQ